MAHLSVSSPFDFVTSVSGHGVVGRGAETRFLEISYQLPGVSCKDNSCWYDYELVNGPCSTIATSLIYTGDTHHIITRCVTSFWWRRGDAGLCVHDTIAPRLFCPIKCRVRC